MKHKILSAFAFISFITIQSSASEGPLKVGNFDPIVCEVMTNKIVKEFLPQATALNKGVLPSGSITAMWSNIGDEKVEPYFASRPAQLEESSPYVHEANNNPHVQKILEFMKKNKDEPLHNRIKLWNIYNLSVDAVYAQREQKTIPEINLLPITVVGIMLMNQDLIFTESETLSFGGAIAAEISILQYIFDQDPLAFRHMYEKSCTSAPYYDYPTQHEKE